MSVILCVSERFGNRLLMPFLAKLFHRPGVSNLNPNFLPNRRVRVERPNVPLPYTDFHIPPFGPNGGSQLMNYDIIEFPEEGNEI